MNDKDMGVQYKLIMSFFLHRSPAELSEGNDGQGTDSISTSNQMRVRWENLSKDLNNKLQLSLNTMEQTQCNTVHNQLQHYNLALFFDVRVLRMDCYI